MGAGSLMVVAVTAVLGAVFIDMFHIHGAVMESSESLLYAGYQYLDLTKIFVASIFMGSSGAVIDLSVDICSAVHEVVEKKPDISAKEAILSGFKVGRAACGTTTTTLLLAYSGSYIALLMVFMAQGTPIEFVLNYKYAAAEIIHTIVGSFGLVTVAPLTAITSGLLFTRREKIWRERYRLFRQRRCCRYASEQIARSGRAASLINISSKKHPEIRVLFAAYRL